jgi:hypothetical protein
VSKIYSCDSSSKQFQLKVHRLMSNVYEILIWIDLNKNVNF